MALLSAEELSRPLPRMYLVQQRFRTDRIEDPAGHVRRELAKPEIQKQIRPGMKIALAVGSRGIVNLKEIVCTAADELLRLGARPFILSAMGSHGGGTPEGQREILNGYQITEETTGIPVVTDTGCIPMGNLSDGLPFYFDRTALQADMVVPINRIKLHTDFCGPIQSGLCKMLAVGLGNQMGCAALHEREPAVFAGIVEETARRIMERVNVGFGLAVIENACHQTAWIEAVPGSGLIQREKELVECSKGFMPALMIPDIDVLLVEEIGKNISGGGFDPQIIGRSPVLTQPAVPTPAIRRMVLLGLSPESHGSAVGMGMFDIVLRSVVEQADLERTYINVLSAKLIEEARIPLIANTEAEAVRLAVKSVRGVTNDQVKIVRIKNTLELEYIQVSESLLPVVQQNPNMRLVPEAPPLPAVLS